jgi:nitroreductase
MAIDVFEAIHTARAFRKFKPDPVPEAVITQILDAAIRAPSAGNAQNWAFVVVRDAVQRRRLGEVYRKGSDIASAMYAARGRPLHVTDEQFQKMMTSGAYLWDRMADAPVILVPCQTAPVLPPRHAARRLPQPLRAGAALCRAHPRRQHLSGDREHHPGLPRARARHHHHHQPHPL